MAPLKQGNDTGDPRIDLALAELTDITGVAGWSVVKKRKSIGKFGRRSLSNGVPALIWEAPDTFETQLDPSDGNLIDTVSSTSTLDTGETIQIEGHYYDPAIPNFGPGLVFHIQQVTLNGQNKVSLSQPLIRTDRQFVVRGNEVVGDVSIYQDTTISGGIPTDTSLIHNQIKGTLGVQQSRKLRLSTSWRDALIIMGGQLSVGRNATASVDFNLEFKPFLIEDAVFRPGTSPVTLTSTGTGFVSFERPVLAAIPPNSDIRVVGTATANSTVASGTLFGYFAVRPDPLAS